MIEGKPLSNSLGLEREQNEKPELTKLLQEKRIRNNVIILNRDIEASTNYDFSATYNSVTLG